MSITERRDSLGPTAGSWDLDFWPDAPRSLTHGLLSLPSCMFGHIIITSVRLTDAAVTAANIKAMARYSGVIRERSGPDLATIGGAGLSIWVSDEDGKDDLQVFDTADWFGNTTFTSVFPFLVPAALTAGTTTNITVAAGFNSISGPTVSRLEALTAAVKYFGAEWRINPNGTVDAGPAATLFPTITTPQVALISTRSGLDGGRDLTLLGMPAQIEASLDADDFTTYVFLQGSSTAGAAGGDSPTLKNWNGNAVHLRRIVDGAQITSGSGDAAAASELNLFSALRQELKVTIDGVYDVGLDVKPGDAIWICAPDQGVVDSANQVYYRGETIYPARARVMSLQWEFQDGMGAYYLSPTASPVPVDLTDYIQPGDSRTELEVGAATRSLPFAAGTRRFVA